MSKHILTYPDGTERILDFDKGITLQELVDRFGIVQGAGYSLRVASDATVLPELPAFTPMAMTLGTTSVKDTQEAGTWVDIPVTLTGREADLSTLQAGPIGGAYFEGDLVFIRIPLDQPYSGDVLVSIADVDGVVVSASVQVEIAASIAPLVIEAPTEVQSYTVAGTVSQIPVKIRGGVRFTTGHPYTVNNISLGYRHYSGTQDTFFFRIDLSAPIPLTTVTFDVTDAAGTKTSGSFQIEVKAAESAGDGSTYLSSIGGTVTGVDNGNGTSTLTVSGATETIYNGSYTVDNAKLNAGLPIWLVYPSVTTNGAVPPTFDASETGLLIYPENDPASVTIAWQADGSKQVGVGDLHTQQPLYKDSKIEGVFNAHNMATGMSPVSVRVLAQEAIVFPSHRVRLSAGAHVRTAQLQGTARTAQRIAQAAWVDVDAINIKFWMSGYTAPDLHVNSPSFNLRQLDQAVRDGVTYDAAGVETYAINGIAAGLSIGDRLCVVSQAEIASGVRTIAVSVNGGEFSINTKTDLPAGALFDLDLSALVFGGDKNGGKDMVTRRMAMWEPPALINLADPLIANEFVDGTGLPKAPERVNAFFGTPLADFRGPVSEWQAGVHHGSLATFEYVATGTYEDLV